MADRPSGSGARVIALLGVFLVAAIALIAWLALRPDAAPPAAPPPKPPPRARVTEPPLPKAPRPKSLEPVLIQPNSQPTGPGGVEPLPGSEDRDLVKLDVLVLGSNGLPAPAATVLLLDPFAQHVGTPKPAELARTKSDDAGHAKFEATSRMVRVFAWLANEAGSSDKFRATKGAATVTVRMSHAIAVKGRVVESGGQPVGDAVVRFVAAPWLDDPFGLLLETKSAADGTFTLPPLPDSAFDRDDVKADIEAQAKGWPTTQVDVTADTLRAGEVVVTLERGAFVRGHLVRPDGKAVASEAVRLTDGRATVRSEADGRFELPLPRGGGVVIALRERPASPAGAAYDYALAGWGAPKLLGRFRGDGGDVDLGDVTLSAGQPVKGVVVDGEEKPVKAGDVVLYLAGVQIAAAQTDDAGKFEIDAVGDDPHLLVATEAPGENAWTGRRHASADDVRGGASDLHIRITGALTVLVKFLSEADNSPVVVPQVTLRTTASGDTPKAYGWTWAGSGIDSVRFEVEHAGTYTATVELPNYEPATTDAFEVSAEHEVLINVLFKKKP